MSLLVVATNPTVDRLVSVPVLRPHHVHRAESLCLSAGGKGLNVGRAAETLGIEALTVGFVGGYSGKLLCELAKAEGLNTSWLELDSIETKMSHLLQHRDGDTTVINEPGPSLRQDQVQAFIRFVADESKRRQAAVFAGSVPPGFAAEDYLQLCRAVKASVPHVLIDTPGKTLKAIIGSPRGFCIKVNREELSEALSKDLPDDRSVVQACRDLLGQGADTVCVTLGKDGAIACSAETGYKACCHSVYAVSSVGSGDSFTAGLILHKLNKLPISQALCWACACGAANTLTEYPAKFALDKVKEILPSVSLEKLY
ncbi:1-phosphofructokinase family hexose kinase [bacterium]|nr:1-phosphofructokinase family hexose kinase [bacterium]